MSRKKNISKSIKNGTTMQTRDEFLASGKNFRKVGYENKGRYRRVVVVDSNSQNELAIVKLLGPGKNKAKSIDGHKSMYKPYIERQNHKGNPIKESYYFKRNTKKHSLSKHHVNNIKKDCLRTSSNKLQKQNRATLRKLKKRK